MYTIKFTEDFSFAEEGFRIVTFSKGDTCAIPSECSQECADMAVSEKKAKITAKKQPKQKPGPNPDTENEFDLSEIAGRE